MKKIMYVEDNKDTAEAVKIMLNHCGYETKTASSGKEGLQLIKKEKFDLVLLDIMLPDMSGWDIYSKLNKEKIKCKFAFLSAIPISSERMQELKSAGVSDYITKPFTKDELIERVSKILKN